MIKTAGKVAVASAVHGQVQRRQQRRWAAEDQRSRPPEPEHRPFDAGVLGDRLAELRLAAELRDSGVLSPAEFEAERARILRS